MDPVFVFRVMPVRMSLSISPEKYHLRGIETLSELGMHRAVDSTS